MSINSAQKSTKSNGLNDVLFRKLFYESRDMLIMFDFVNDICLDVNDSVLDFSGYSREEFLQLSRYDLTPKYSDLNPGVDLHSKYLEQHAEKVIHGEIITELGIFSKKDGSEIIAELEIIPTERKIGEAFIIVKDVTVQIQKSFKYRNTELKLKSIVESTKAGITIVDLSGNHTYVSPKIEEINGYTVEEMIDKPMLNYFAEGSHAALKKYFSDLINGKETPSTLILEAIHKNGNSIWIQGSAVLIKDSKGKSQAIQTIFLDITDKVLLEQQLTHTDDRYQRIIENLDGIFILVDLNGVVEYVSPNYTSRLGYDVVDVVGKKGLSVFCEEDQNLIKNESAKILRGEQDSYNGTFKVFHKDGSEKWISGTFSLTKNEKGEPNGFVSVYLDVTQEKVLRQQLISSEDRNQNLFNNVIDPIIIRDLKTLKIKDCNQAALEFFNLESKSRIEELNNFALGVSNEAGESFQQIVKAQIKQAEKKKSTTFTVNYKNPEEQKFIIEINLVIDKSNPQNPNCVFFLKDITQQTLAFEKVRKERALLNAVLEGIPDHIIVEDVNRDILAVNSNFKKAFYDANKVKVEIGSNMNQINELVRTAVYKDNKSWEDKMKSVLAGNSFEHQFTSEVHQKKYHRNLTASPLKDDDKNVIGIIGVVRDVTELVEKNEVIAVKNEELQKYIDSNIQLENFAYIASHDLKQPLRTIMSFSELLKEKKASQLDNDSNVYINFILDSAKRLDNLVNDMLAYSIIGTDGNKENINLELLIMQVILDLDAQIKQTKATINIQSIPESIFAYRTDIRSLFLNLISNAIKYSKPDLPPLINISAQEDSAKWTFRVEDNGIGIAQNHLDKIFGMFQRLEVHNDASGTGIGLAHCKKIIELHEGEIWAESEIAKGTNLIFTIPKQENN